MGRLNGKTAFITGAASGIGAACALRFAQEGASLAGFDLEKPADGAWAEAVKEAPDACFASGDVRSDEDLGAAVSAAQQRFGSVDVLVNSAGVAGGGPVHLVEPEDWQFDGDAMGDED